MRLLKVVLLLTMAALLVVAMSAPIGPVPGFFIGGERVAAPASWPDTSNVDEIRLKAPGTLPRVVIIWVIDVAGELYVIGTKDSGWVQRLGDSSPAELRIGDSTYAVTANRVTEDMEQIWRAYVGKYEADYPDIIASFPPIEEAAQGASIFRLSAS